MRKPNGYWSKERVLEDAKQYKHVSIWEAKSSSAHTIACKNRWFRMVPKPTETFKTKLLHFFPTIYLTI
jgi:hypothetical protein